MLSDDAIFQEKWDQLKSLLNTRFGEDFDMNGILFLIGIQELATIPDTLGKQEKIEIIHVAVCKLLSLFGCYEFERIDADGWPHYLPTETLKGIPRNRENRFIQEAIIRYFEDY